MTFRIGDKVTYTSARGGEGSVGFVTEVTRSGRIRVCAKQVFPTFDSDNFVFRPGWLLTKAESAAATKMPSSNYAEDGTRLTDCCAAYSTFHDDVLCCKVCWNEVSVGEGDGTLSQGD